MKLNLSSLPIAFIATLITTSFARAEFGSVFEGFYSLYDVTGAYAYGAKAGVSYQTESSTHYLLGSGFYVEQDDVDGILFQAEVDSVGFSLAYRYGFSKFENFEPYVEYGWNRISSSYNTKDALGSIVELDFKSKGDYLAVGVLYNVAKDVRLKAEVGYFGVLSDNTLSTPLGNAIGNVSFAEQTIRLSASIGIVFEF